MSITKTKISSNRKYILGTCALRGRASCLCGPFVAAAVFLCAVPLMAASSPSHGLCLSATIKNGELVAVLTNTYNHSVKTVGEHVTAIPGSGGFYVRLQDRNGISIKYCGMIDSENPTERLLEPNEKIVYRDKVESLLNQYCLTPGKYSGRVVYYNSLMFGKEKYSQPIESRSFEILVPTLESSPHGSPESQQ